MTGNTLERDGQRRLLRRQRRALPRLVREQAGRQVARHADAMLHLRQGWRIGVYASLREELDTTALIELARRRGCHIYLPVISRAHASRRMSFAQMSGSHRFNRLGIAEPQGPPLPSVRFLDIVFVPLVGFDARGVRLGMGGGYYDRAFAFRRTRTVWHAPKLVGLAYAFQQLPFIERAAHDVLLDMVVTEQGVIRCTTG